MNSASVTSCSMTTFTSLYGNCLPLVVRLTVDQLRRDVPAVWIHMEHTSTTSSVSPRLSLRSTLGGRLARVMGVMRQRRVVAVDAHSDRLYAVPLDSRETFTLRDGHNRRFFKKYRTLQQITSKHSMPLLVDHKPPPTTTMKSVHNKHSSARFSSTAALGTLMLKETQDMSFVALNFIKHGAVDSDVWYMLIDSTSDVVHVEVLETDELSSLRNIDCQVNFTCSPTAIFDLTPVQTSTGSHRRRVVSQPPPCNGAHTAMIASSLTEIAETDDVTTPSYAAGKRSHELQPQNYYAQESQLVSAAATHQTATSVVGISMPAKLEAAGMEVCRCDAEQLENDQAPQTLTEMTLSESAVCHTAGDAQDEVRERSSKVTEAWRQTSPSGGDARAPRRRRVLTTINCASSRGDDAGDVDHRKATTSNRDANNNDTSPDLGVTNNRADDRKHSSSAATRRHHSMTSIDIRRNSQSTQRWRVVPPTTQPDDVTVTSPLAQLRAPVTLTSCSPPETASSRHYVNATPRSPDQRAPTCSQRQNQPADVMKRGLSHTYNDQARQQNSVVTSTLPWRQSTVVSVAAKRMEVATQTRLVNILIILLSARRFQQAGVSVLQIKDYVDIAINEAQ